jgi:uncharacterized membrane protein (UPF0127 family)
LKKLLNQTKNSIILEDLKIANSFYSRAKGLLGKSHLENKEGLWIFRTNTIHTFFMKFSIDCVFIDRNLKVIGLRPNVKPWRMTYPVWKASHVIEVCKGTIQDQKVEIGDQLHVVG